MIKERQENVILTILSGSITAAERTCVCCGGTSSDSTTIKDAVLRNFDLTYLPCCLYPPSHIPCDEGGSLEGWVHRTIKVNWNIFYLFQFDLVPNLWGPISFYDDYILCGNFKLLATDVHYSKQATLILL